MENLSDLIDAFRRAASEIYGDEGTCEIDADAVVSLSEISEGISGAYVQAWVWVDLDQLPAEFQSLNEAESEEDGN